MAQGVKGTNLTLYVDEVSGNAKRFRCSPATKELLFKINKNLIVSVSSDMEAIHFRETPDQSIGFNPRKVKGKTLYIQAPKTTVKGTVYEIMEPVGRTFKAVKKTK